MSDETVFSQIVVESIAQMGYLMRVPSAKVRSSLADAIISLYCKPPEITEVLEVSMFFLNVILTFNHYCVGDTIVGVKTNQP